MSDSPVKMVGFEDYLRNRGLSEGSIYQYTKAVQKFLSLSESNMEEIETYNEFILEFAIKKRSLYYYDALILFIKFFFDDNKQKRNQMLKQLLKPNKNNDTKRMRRILDDETREQVISLLKDYKHRIIARIQNETGVRAGDIIRLKRGSIMYEPYQDKEVMRIDFEGKGGKHFVKWIFDEAVQNQIYLFITSNILDDIYYFLEREKSNKGSSFISIYRTNYHHYWDDLKQAINMLGYDFKDWASHDFRKAFARTVWNKYKDPVLLKEALNHEQFETTLTYLRNSGLQIEDMYAELHISKEEKK